MLAGLLFATRDALDRPDALAATLPLGGMTLIEYQARLLIGAGASQIVVVVSRLTPELLGALARIGRRGVAVDTVRNAVEASEKMHPLARVLMLADGLITGDAVVSALAGEGGDALMVVDVATAPASFEKVGSHAAWAGVARLDPRRLAEVARLPRDYDMQSTLVRVASQASAALVPLPVDALADGHGIERRATAIAERGRAMLASMVARRTAWFDRYLVGPVARRALPALVERAVPAPVVAVAAAAAGTGGLATVAFGHAATGLVLVVLASMTLSLGGTLARLRDEPRLARGMETGTAVLAAVSLLLVGRDVQLAAGDASGIVMAVALVAAAALAERTALPAIRRRWWGSPAAYPVVALPLVAMSLPLAGLAIAAVYAGVTLAAGVEALRRQA